MAKDGYKFVRDRRNVTFLNTLFSRYPYINQLLKVCPRNTGSVEVSGSIPLGPLINLYKSSGYKLYSLGAFVCL
jgi:hypothetical protein